MSIQDDIAGYAQQYGLDPAYALATASRESSFNPNAHASKTIYGLFQMSKGLRDKYGVPLGSDVGTQVRGFAAFTNDLRDQMKGYLGRDPTPEETYIGHFWGPARAAGIINGTYADHPARDVFTPRELAENRNLDPDKPVGEIAEGIRGDMGKRLARYGGGTGGEGAGSLLSYGVTEDGETPKEPPQPKPARSTQTADLTSFGSPAAADPSTSAAISDLAGQDANPLGGLGDALKTAASKTGSGSSDEPAPTAPTPQQNPEVELGAKLAMAQQQPIQGVPLMPGGRVQASILPGSTSPRPQFNPAMFGAG